MNYKRSSMKGLTKNMANNVTQAFVYKWIHIPTGMWYIGSRTAKGCHVNDGYICSSRIVKPMILCNPEEWKRIIINTGTPQEMRRLETSMLMGCNAKKDPMSFNRSNNDGKPSGGRPKNSKTKKLNPHKHLECQSLSKLNAKQLAQLFLEERQRIEDDRLGRLLMLYKFAIPKVAMKG